MSRGNLRMLYDTNGEGIEITCPICREYSAGSDIAVEHGNGWRIPLNVLEKTPYVCKCGTTYRTQMGHSHWHLFIDVPESLLK